MIVSSDAEKSSVLYYWLMQNKMEEKKKTKIKEFLFYCKKYF